MRVLNADFPFVDGRNELDLVAEYAAPSAADDNSSMRTQSPNAGKELGRFKTVWGKGKRALEWEIVMKVADDPAPKEQVADEFARIVARLVRAKLL